MPKKTCCGVLFTVLVSALLIAGICFNATEGVAYAQVPPTTSDNYDRLWHTSNFTITLTATDNTAVNATYYRINNGPIQNVTANGQPFITTEGADNTLEYWSVDNASNQETHTMLTDIKLDKTAPTGTITINDDAASTTSTQVTLTISAEDATSGVAQMHFFEYAYTYWEEYATSKFYTLNTTNAGYKTVYVQVRDNAGLVSAARNDTIWMGSDPPPVDPPMTRAPPAETPQKTPEKPPETIVPKDTAPPEINTEAFPLWIVIIAAAMMGIVIATAAAATALLRQKRK